LTEIWNHRENTPQHRKADVEDHASVPEMIKFVAGARLAERSTFVQQIRPFFFSMFYSSKAFIFSPSAILSDRSFISSRS
jgi:hypothetical protein